MSRKSYQRDISFLVFCGVISGILIFLLIQKHRQLAVWNTFMEDYAYIAQVIHLPQDYAFHDDSMQDVIIDEVLASRLHYDQKDILQHQEQLRANLELLTKDFVAAREHLGPAITADDWYAHATVDVLEAWNLSVSTGVVELARAYDLIEQGKSGFATARLLVQDKSREEKILYTAGLTEELSSMVGIQLIFYRFEEVFVALTKLKTSFSILDTLLDEVLHFLTQWDPKDPLLITCKETLLVSLPLAKDDVALSTVLVAKYEDALATTFQRCVQDIPACVLSSQGVYESFMYVLESITLKIRTYSATFYDLDELLLQGYDGPLISFCTSLDAQDGDASDLLSEMLLELTQPEGEQTYQEGVDEVLSEKQDGEGMHDAVEPEWADYLLDDIKKTQTERLQQKYDLEKVPGYSPHQLLDAMFLEFKGNDTGFIRE